jgi:GDPmannose 4,6-dehydratase
MYAVSGILYNHESPRRGLEFVTRKISSHVARIKAGKIRELRLGNLEARRDWGHARDHVQAIWSMLQQESPEDLVIATGKAHSVQEFVDLAFAHAGLDPAEHVVLDPRFHRPAEVDILLGNAAKARAKLGWQPTVDFASLVREMVDADLREHTEGPEQDKSWT